MLQNTIIPLMNQADEMLRAFSPKRDVALQFRIHKAEPIIKEFPDQILIVINPE
jgi:hypothetical protein